MDIGSFKSANSRINIVKKENNFRMIVKIIEMGDIFLLCLRRALNVNYRKGGNGV